MEPVQTRLAGVYEALKGDFNYTNVNQAPTIEKVVVSVGRPVEDKQKIALIQDRMAKITGQKAAPGQAKKSIASFKLREGDVIGYQVTCVVSARSTSMLIHIACHRRDFRGLKTSSIDEMGNYPRIMDNTIFPETRDEELRMCSDVGHARDDCRYQAEVEALLRHIGLPLQKPAEAAE